MSEPRLPSDPELESFVALLRGATPSPDVLDDARAGVLGASPTPPATIEPSEGPGAVVHAVKLGVLALTLFVLGAPHTDEAAFGLTKIGRLAPVAAIGPKDARRAPAAVDREPAVALEPAGSDEPPIDSAEPVAEPAARPSARASSEDPSSSKGGRIGRLVPDLPLQLRVEPVPVIEAGPSAPSEAMAEALRDYAAERYDEAAVAFQRVVEGASDDRDDRVAQAEFFLAKCLYHLELFHASAAAFDEVTRRGAEHPYFEASLTWLAMLAERLPEPSGVIESVGRYEPAQLARLDVDGTRAHYHRLLYLLGRSRYQERRFREAVGLFRRVPEDAAVSLEARFFEGISHVRMRRARPAHLAFGRVIDAVEAGRTGSHEEPERMRDLAWMSVARLYYTVAMQLPAGRNERASELLSHAVAAWRRIPLSSEHWLDSFFEETWALYVAREHARALGHVHALESPYFRDRANPESLVVRAMIQYEHCQWDQVERSLGGFHARYDGVLAAAEQAERMVASNEDAFRVLVAVRADRSRVPAPIVPALRAAFEDRELSRHLEQVHALDREQARLGRLAPELLASGLATRVGADLAVLRSLAVDRTGQLAAARVRRLAEDLRERMTQMDTIELELATQRREELTRPNRRPMGPPEGGRIWAVQGDQIWPWDGEWWRDELPFFHQEIESRCGR